MIISKFNIFLSKIILLFSISSSSRHNYSHFRIMVYLSMQWILLHYIETQNYYDLFAVLKHWTYKITAKYTFHNVHEKIAKNKTISCSFHKNPEFFREVARAREKKNRAIILSLCVYVCSAECTVIHYVYTVWIYINIFRSNTLDVAFFVYNGKCRFCICVERWRKNDAKRTNESTGEKRLEIKIQNDG